MNCKAIWLVSMFLLVNCASTPRSNKHWNKSLRMEIGLSKSEYLLNEPIFLDVTLTNITDDTARYYPLYPEFHYGFSIDIWNNRRDSVFKINMVADLSGYRRASLGPHEERYRCIDILLLYGESQHGLLGAVWFPHLPPGEYHLRAHQLGVPPQELTFKVREPKGEERVVYDLLWEAILLWSKHDSDIVIGRLQLLYDRFPNSAYAEKIFWELPYDEEFLNKYPNSGFNETNVPTLARNMTEKEKEEFFRRIVQDHPHTRSAWFVRELLLRSR